MLQIVLQIYRFIKGGFAQEENIMTTTLPSAVNFAYEHHLHVGQIATNG
jgi:hypothetical protein